MEEEKRIDAYREIRARWARAHNAVFKKDVEDLCTELGVEPDTEALEKACERCVNKLNFGYPAEYVLAESVFAGMERDDVLPYTAAIMRKYRVSFAEEWK